MRSTRKQTAQKSNSEPAAAVEDLHQEEKSIKKPAKKSNVPKSAKSTGGSVKEVMSTPPSTNENSPIVTRRSRRLKDKECQPPSVTVVVTDVKPLKEKTTRKGTKETKKSPKTPTAAVEDGISVCEEYVENSNDKVCEGIRVSETPPKEDRDLEQKKDLKTSTKSQKKTSEKSETNVNSKNKRGANEGPVLGVSQQNEDTQSSDSGGCVHSKRTDLFIEDGKPSVTKPNRKPGRSKAKPKAKSRSAETSREKKIHQEIAASKLTLEDPPEYVPGDTAVIFRRSLQQSQEEELTQSPPPPFSSLEQKSVVVEEEMRELPNNEFESPRVHEELTEGLNEDPIDEDFSQIPASESTPMLSRAFHSVTNMLWKFTGTNSPKTEGQKSPVVEETTPVSEPTVEISETPKEAVVTNPSTPCFGKNTPVTTAEPKDLDNAQERGRQLLRASLTAGERTPVLRTVSEPPRPRKQIKDSYIAINHGCLDDDSVWTLSSLRKLAKTLQISLDKEDDPRAERSNLIDALNRWNRDSRVPNAAANNSKAVAFPMDEDSDALTLSVCNFHNLPVGPKQIPERWTKGFTPLRKERQLKSILRGPPCQDEDLTNPMLASGQFATPKRSKAKNGLTFSPYNSVATFFLPEVERTAKQMRMIEIAKETNMVEIDNPTKELCNEPEWREAQENAKRNVEKSLPHRNERPSFLDCFNGRDSVNSVLNQLSPCFFGPDDTSPFDEDLEDPENSFDKFEEHQFPGTPHVSNFPNKLTPPTPPRPRPQEAEDPETAEDQETPRFDRPPKRSRDILLSMANTSNNTPITSQPLDASQENAPPSHQAELTDVPKPRPRDPPEPKPKSTFLRIKKVRQTGDLSFSPQQYSK